MEESEKKEKRSFKIAISSTGNTLDDSVDQRFGRCPYFIIAEIEIAGSQKQLKDFKAVENISASQSGAAGISAAKLIAENEVEAVLTGNLGPNASNVLSQFDIKTYHASGKIKDAVEKFIKDELDQITETVESHFGMNHDSQPEETDSSDRIFIPLLDDKGEDSEISAHFGHAPFFAIYDTAKKELTISENSLDHADASRSPVDQIKDMADPTVVFALGIGSRAIMLFKEKGINLKTGPFKTLKEVIDNIDKLEDLTRGCGH